MAALPSPMMDPPRLSLHSKLAVGHSQLPGITAAPVRIWVSGHPQGSIAFTLFPDDPQLPSPTIESLYEAVSSELQLDAGAFRLAYGSKDLRLEGPSFVGPATLADYDVQDGATVQILLRLRGGADLNLTIRSSYGCWLCAGRLFCVCCGSCVGSKFKVKVRSIDSVQVIWDRLKEQNPKVDPGSLTYGNEMLEAERKILFYKIHDGAHIDMQLPPTKLFIGGPKQPKPEQKDMQKEIEEAKANVAASQAEQTPPPVEEPKL